MADLCRAAMTGDQSTVETISTRIAELNRVLFLESNPIPVKWALSYLGRVEAGIRLPLTVLSEAHHSAVIAALESCKELSC